MATKTEEKRSELRVIERRPGGDYLHLNFHPGQLRAWESQKRFVAMFAGAQGGKTTFGAHWLRREVEEKGPGDYLAVTATFPLLNLKMLPEFLYVFETLHAATPIGHYKDSIKTFVFNDGKTRVIFGSATNPESLEAATAKGAWLDEAGQKQFRRDSWEAVRRRLSIHQGRVLFTTTLYTLGWLKNDIYDQWVKGDSDIDVIQFDSTLNPNFPMEEYEKARKSMPAWKFDMFYRGRYSKPAGLIYDCFDEKKCCVDRFEIPKEWKRYVGVDFGAVHTAAIWYAEQPTTGYLYAYREYMCAEKKEVSEHAWQFQELSRGESILKCTGGSHQESGWRDAFNMAGWFIAEPLIRDVEVGIDRVYAWHKENRLFVFRDLEHYIDEKLSYSRELNENYEPTDKIESKERYHLMDCLVAGTQILTDGGGKSIENIKIGDKVLTRKGYFPVKATIKKEADTVTASFSDGTFITGTKNHKVFVRSKGFVPLDELRYYDIIESWKKKQSFSMESNTIDTPTQSVNQTGFISSIKGKYSIELFGKPLMARFLKGIISIIKTGILLITAYPIWNLNLFPSICPCTINIGGMTLKHSGGCSHSLRCGTPRQRAENGIDNMLRKCGQEQDPSKKNVNIVASHTKQSNQGIVNSVQRVVEQPVGFIQGLMTRCVNVLCAVGSTKTISMPEQKHAHGIADIYFLNLKPSHKTIVYDLNVDAVHEYFANGILVHNSERYILCDFMPIALGESGEEKITVQSW